VKEKGEESKGKGRGREGKGKGEKKEREGTPPPPSQIPGSAPDIGLVRITDMLRDCTTCGTG